MDKLELRIVNAVDLNEVWLDDYYSPEEAANMKLVKIFINGEDLKETIISIERPYFTASGFSPDFANYGHNTVETMLYDFEQLDDKDSYTSKYGIELFCCPDCGIGGCWSVVCNFRKENGTVYMENFRHNHRDLKYDLSYRFTIENFEAEIEKLRKAASVTKD